MSQSQQNAAPQTNGAQAPAQPSKLDQLKSVASSDQTKQIAKNVAIGVGVVVGGGLAYAVFATVANKAYAAMN